MEGADLEPIDLAGVVAAEDDGDRRASRRWMPVVVVLVAAAALGLWDEVRLHARVEHLQVQIAAERERAAREAAAGSAARVARDSAIEAERADAARRRDAKADAESGFSARGTRELILDKRAPQWCKARDLRMLDSGITFLRFKNVSGRPCALADHPVLLSPQGDGYWDPVPVFPSLESSYSDGPTWNGVFEPQLTAVLSIEDSPLNPDLGVCLTGRGPHVPFGPLALQLRDDDERLPLPGATLTASDCRPVMRLWAYDTTDA